jgi:hypothetical protein
MAQIDFEPVETNQYGQAIGALERATRGNSPDKCQFIVKRIVIRSTRHFLCQPGLSHLYWATDKIHSEIVNSRLLANQMLECYDSRPVQFFLRAYDEAGAGNRIQVTLHGDYKEGSPWEGGRPVWVPHTLSLAPRGSTDLRQGCNYGTGVLQGFQGWSESGPFDIDVICRDANFPRTTVPCNGNKLEGDAGKIRANNRRDDILEITVRNRADVPNRIYLACFFA